VIYLHSYPSLRYNTFNDFEPIAHLANFAIALAVSTDTPAATLAEYVKVVQGNANFGNYGSASPGSIPHFFGLMLARHANVTLTHIPYKGTAPMLQALAAGEIKAGIGTLADIGSLARGGKAKLLAISSAQRSTHFPNVPTFKEAGFDIQGSGWYAVYAPAKTPRAEIDRLAKALIDAVKMPDITEKWANMGLEPTGLGPEDTARITKADYERWGPVIKASGFKPDQ
jgi:tripartite-type tricarboxylate transporter receptor subunit TctC